MRQINRNPLGIRKLDVQEARRGARNHAKHLARQILRTSNQDPDDPRLRHLVEYALMKGWEEGVHTGAQATRERVAEALDRGTLRMTS